MATVYYFTGFEGVANTEQLQSLLSRTPTFDNPSLDFTHGYQDGQCMKISPIADFMYLWGGARIDIPSHTSFPGGHAPVAVGFHVKDMVNTQTTFTPTKGCLVSFVGADYSTPIILIGNHPSGLIVYGYNTLGAWVSFHQADRKISENLTWVEAKLDPTPEDCTLIVKINGVTVIDEEFPTAAGGEITGVHFQAPIGNVGDYDPYYIDNVYIADDFTGEVCSILCHPSGDWAVEWELGGTGSEDSSAAYNYAMVDEVIQDDDESYVTSFTIGERDLYDFDDIEDEFDVVAVAMVTVARKYEAGYRALKHVSYYLSNEYELDNEYIVGADYPATVQEAFMEVMPTAPDCTDWTAAKWNDTKVGFKISG